MSDVAGLLRDVLQRCPPAERRVARLVLADYPAKALLSSAALAAAAEVSTPTVLRLVGRIGFPGWGAFQQAVRDELSNPSPVTLYATTGFAEHSETDAAALAASSGAAVLDAVRGTYEALPAGELDAALTLLADPARSVVVHGGRFTGLFARYLTLHLTQVRGAVVPLPDGAVERAATLALLRKRDVVVLFDHRRYEPATLRIAQLARERQAKVVLVTDPWLSPVAAVADVVLTTKVTTSSPYDSLVPVAALVETLVTGVLARLGDAALQRMQRIEDATGRFDLYGA